MPFGLVLSLIFHASLLGLALFSTRSLPPLSPDTPTISADIVTPSEFLHLKQGSEDSKHLETKTNDMPMPDDSKNDAQKPGNEPPPQPEPASGPTPEEKKAWEERQVVEAAKKKVEEEAKQKALADTNKKTVEGENPKNTDCLKKKKREDSRKEAAVAKKKFDTSELVSLLEKSPGDAPPKAIMLDKGRQKKWQQVSGSKPDVFDAGKETGTATDADTVLSAREQDLLKRMLKSQLNGCWRLPTGGGQEVPVVELHWELDQDGTLVGEPRVMSAPNTTAGQVYAEVALRAVRLCAPFHLPADKYNGGWKYIDWTFDPRQMF